jgi:hypothetical protein
MNESTSRQIADLEFVRQVSIIIPIRKITPRLYARVQAGFFGVQVPGYSAQV